MAVPEMVDWEDVEGFKYGNKKMDDYLDDIVLKHFLIPYPMKRSLIFL